MKRREDVNFHNFMDNFPHYFNMIWEPVDCDNVLTSLGAGSSFFLQRLPGKCLLFIHEGELTSILVLQLEGKRLVVDCVKSITARHSVLRITGNNNCILMVDVKEELFYLQGTVGDNVDCFNHNNANIFLTSDGILSWQRLHQLTNCLTMTGITNGVSFLYHNESVYAAHYGTIEIRNGLCEISKKRLNNFHVGTKYFVAKLKGEMSKIVSERVLKSLMPSKEVLLVIEPSQIYFIIPKPDGQVLSQPYSIDLQTDTVINVLNFQKKNWILIICKSGKIVCLTFNNSFKSFQFRHAWLPKPVSAIVGYEDDMIYLLWSDLNNFYMSTFNDDNVITNIKVPQNIRGVRHFVKIDDNIISITVNGCLYETRTPSILDQETKMSSHCILKSMFETAKKMEKLTEEVSIKEDLMKAVELSRISNISRNIHIIEKENMIVLENKTEYLFKKGLWRVLFETEDSQRKHSEMKELENDIVPGGSITFKCSENVVSNITLVSDIMGDVISIELEVECDSNKTGNEHELIGIKQFLKEKCTFIA